MSYKNSITSKKSKLPTELFYCIKNKDSFESEYIYY